jgi:hypothetical protein
VFSLTDLGSAAVSRRKARKLHIAIEPPVEVDVGDHRVTFDGVNLLRPHVMIEYVVDPPIAAESPFGPHLLLLDVTDDTSEEHYPTAWEDFRWPHLEPGRTTTRLERRPPAEATRLHVRVRPVNSPLPAVPGPGSALIRAVAEFDVHLPPDHAQPWQPPTTDRA